MHCLDAPSIARSTGDEVEKLSVSNEKLTSTSSAGKATQSNRRVVIVGIPGVGKSSVVHKVVEMMGDGDQKPEVVNYGTTMMEEATRGTWLVFEGPDEKTSRGR